MQSMEKVLLLIIGLSGFQCTHTVIVRGEIWRKKRDDGSYCYVYNMYDVHTSMHHPEAQLKQKINNLVIDQGEALLRNFKKLNPQFTKIVVEDSASNRDGTYAMPIELLNIMDKLPNQSRELVDRFFVRMKDAGISQAINIEYRQKRLTLMGYVQIVNLMGSLEAAVNSPETQGSVKDQIIPLLDLYRQVGLTLENLEKFKGHFKVNNSTLLEEVSVAINTIQAYQDGQVLSQYYQLEVARIKTSNNRINQLLNTFKEKTFGSVLGSFVSESEGALFQTVFPYWGASLLDANALHEIYQAGQSIQKIFFLAGGAHSYTVATMLPRIGYELVYETGINKSMLEPIHKKFTEVEVATDVAMNMGWEQWNRMMQDNAGQLSRLFAVFKKRIPFNKVFFDLMLSDNPEEGGALGHGPIQ